MICYNGVVFIPGMGVFVRSRSREKNGSFMLSMQLNGYLIGFQVNNLTNNEIISFFEFTVRTTQIHLHFPSFSYPDIAHQDTSKHAMFLPIFVLPKLGAGVSESTLYYQCFQNRWSLTYISLGKSCKFHTIELNNSD